MSSLLSGIASASYASLQKLPTFRRTCLAKYPEDVLACNIAQCTNPFSVGVYALRSMDGHEDLFDGFAECIDLAKKESEVETGTERTTNSIFACYVSATLGTIHKVQLVPDAHAVRPAPLTEKQCALLHMYSLAVHFAAAPNSKNVPPLFRCEYEALDSKEYSTALRVGVRRAIAAFDFFLSVGQVDAVLEGRRLGRYARARKRMSASIELLKAHDLF